jgi:hypothetical protein
MNQSKLQPSSSALFDYTKVELLCTGRQLAHAQNLLPKLKFVLLHTGLDILEVLKHPAVPSRFFKPILGLIGW